MRSVREAQPLARLREANLFQWALALARWGRPLPSEAAGARSGSHLAQGRCLRGSTHPSGSVPSIVEIRRVEIGPPKYRDSLRYLDYSD